MSKRGARIECVEKVRRSAQVALLSLFLAGPLLAWGQDGHRITGEIAERQLNEAARAAVEKVLGGDSLARVSTWPDEIRSYPSWRCASPFHYLTAPIGARYPDQGVAQGDALQALVYFTDLLRASESSAGDRRTALSFIVHLVGDLHQPLHSGRGCDRGGNELDVVWFDEEVRLHEVWDSKIIESQNLSFTEWVEFHGRIEPHEVSILEGATPLDWIGESRELLDGVYTCFTGGDRCPCYCGDCRESGTSSFGGCKSQECSLLVGGPARLSWTYATVQLPVVRDRLLAGGVRLAGLLNWIFDSEAEAPEAFAKMAAEVRRLKNFDTEMMDTCRGEANVFAVAAADADSSD